MEFSVLQTQYCPEQDIHTDILLRSNHLIPTIQHKVNHSAGDCQQVTNSPPPPPKIKQNHDTEVHPEIN